MEQASSSGSRVALKPTSNKFRRLGRWARASPVSDSIVASWCGASISFLFSGSYLSIRTGERTERKDSFNGGTPMIACTISAYPRRKTGPGIDNDQVNTYDCGPSQEVILVDADTLITGALPVRLTLTLVDWASVFGLDSLIVDSEDDVQADTDDPPPVRVLAIGDSITAGYSDGSQPVPLGCLNAYPHVARERIQTDTGTAIELELVAFPGITLVAPTLEERDEGVGQGMIDKFFNVSQWSDEPANLDEQPSIILIALGTNDDAQDVSPERFASSMRTFIERVLQAYRASVKHICVLHPFPDFTEDSEFGSLETSEQVPITRDLSSVLDALRSVTEESVEFHEWNIGGDLRREHTMDGLHPTLSGHRTLGDTLARMVVPLLYRSGCVLT